MPSSSDMDTVARKAIYRPLQGADSIRLLELQPGSDDEPLRCHLLHIDSVSHAPDYESISYVWGDPNDTEPIKCRKLLGLSTADRYDFRARSKDATRRSRQHQYVSIEITKSLAGALSTLRHPATTRLLWADGICINQKDKLERNQQVAIMGQIYAECRRVIVWLGPSDEHTEPALDMISKISDFCQDYSICHGVLNPPNTTNMVNSSLEDSLKQSLRHSQRMDSWDWEEELSAAYPADKFVPTQTGLILDFLKQHVFESGALYKFFARNYFRRLWVIQEVAMGRDIRVHCGNLQLSWHVLALSATFLVLAGLPANVDHQKGFHNADNAVILYNVYRPLEDENGSGTFLDLLSRTSEFEAGDDRDKVYGLLGYPISCPDSEVVDTFFFQIRPDYGKETFQVFYDVAVGSLQHLKSLRILSYAENGSVDDKLQQEASWVPRWYTGLESDPIDLRGTYFDAAAFSCSDNRIMPWRLSGTTLSVSGIRCGSVQSTSPLLRPSLLDPKANVNKNPLFDTLDGTSKLLLDLQITIFERSKGEGAIHKWHVTLYEQLLAYALSLSAGGVGNGRANLDGSQITTDFARYLSELYHSGSREQDPPLFAHLSKTGIGEHLSDLSAHGNGEEFFRYARYAFDGRRLFRTTQGRIGLGPAAIQPDDIPCVLQGGRSIYALRLRPDGSGWRFIGECYLHGCMHGELMKDRSWSDGAFEQFDLI